MTTTHLVRAARYDGIAGVYEEIVTSVHADHHADVATLADDLLGAPPAVGRLRLVDLGCGPGVVSERFKSRWHVTGVDVSGELLSLARAARRADVLLLADAANVPLPDGCADAVLSTYTHTDVEDWAAVVAEGARLLASSGVIVYVGAHPCFVGPHAERSNRAVIHHPGYYHTSGLLFNAPGFTRPDLGGLRARIGVRHLTLTQLFTPFTTVGTWRNAQIVENEDDPPTLIGISAVKC